MGLRSRVLFLSAMISAALFLPAPLAPNFDAAHAAVFAGQPHPSPVLVELFTSEGCSSCPPADALLRQIDERQTQAGQLIVGISEHVTYWNRLGWTDPYSSETFTQRQSAYAARLGLDSVYTPQMVVDGRQQIIGSDADALQRALAQEASQRGIELRILAHQIEGDTLTLRFSARQTPAGTPLDIVAVITDDTDRSNVLRGENAGQALQHVAVARALLPVAEIHADSEQTARLTLPPSTLANHATGHRLILFAQRPQAGPVMGIDTQPL
jgi:hypothetical protein